jgi:peptidoglycan DL-endopeptidase LytF
MKALNPFNAPGSPQAERQRLRRERFKIVVWSIVAANVMLFAGMLIQGCKREPDTTGGRESNPADTASSDTNAAAAAQAASGTNGPVTPTFEAPASNTTAAAAVTPPAPEVPQPGARQYVVLKGDSLYKIAQANKVSTKALADANPGVDSRKLKVGQTLQVPAATAVETASQATPPTSAGAKASEPSGNYVVKRGDTLDRIARTHRTTVSALKAANGLTSDRIVAGRSLKLPGPKAAAGTQT